MSDDNFPKKIWTHEDAPGKYTILCPIPGSVEWMRKSEHQALLREAKASVWEEAINAALQAHADAQSFGGEEDFRRAQDMIMNCKIAALERLEMEAEAKAAELRKGDV
jgi:hypothetical protein